MTRPFDAPHAGARPETSSTLTVLLVACLALGGLGLLSSLSGVASLALSLAPDSLGLSPEQAAIVEEARQGQSVWALPLNIGLQVLKLGLSLGLIAGSVASLAGRAPGRLWLDRVLTFGIVFEIGAWLVTVVLTLLNQQAMADRFGRAMQTDPNLPPELGAAAGQMFGRMMVIGMVGMVVWVLAKVALYAGTLRVLRREAATG